MVGLLSCVTVRIGGMIRSILFTIFLILSLYVNAVLADYGSHPTDTDYALDWQDVSFTNGLSMSFVDGKF